MMGSVGCDERLKVWWVLVLFEFGRWAAQFFGAKEEAKTFR